MHNMVDQVSYIFAISIRELIEKNSRNGIKGLSVASLIGQKRPKLKELPPGESGEAWGGIPILKYPIVELEQLTQNLHSDVKIYSSFAPK